MNIVVESKERVEKTIPREDLEEAEAVFPELKDKNDEERAVYITKKIADGDLDSVDTSVIDLAKVGDTLAYEMVKKHPTAFDAEENPDGSLTVSVPKEIHAETIKEPRNQETIEILTLGALALGDVLIDMAEYVPEVAEEVDLEETPLVEIEPTTPKEIVEKPTTPPPAEPEPRPWGTGWHNDFRFRYENGDLVYDVVLYNEYIHRTDRIGNVQPGNHIAHRGEVWGGYNTGFVVYVSGGELRYQVLTLDTMTFSGILDTAVTSVRDNFVRFTTMGKNGVTVNWTDDHGKGHYAVIDQWHGLTKKERSTADDRAVGEEIELSIDSLNAGGVKFIAPETGSYTLTIVGGAFCNLPETDVNWPKYGGWHTTVILYINKPVEWGDPDVQFGPQPINFDYELGSDERYPTFAEAETAGRGLSLTVHLDKNDYIIALKSDRLDYYYDNSGIVRIRITGS